MASLQEQLLKAGVVDKKKAKHIKQEKRKAAKRIPKGQEQVDETREQVKRSMEEKAQRDRDLNRKQQEEADSKALRAQVIQLIRMNRIDRRGGDVPHQFSDDGKIKKLHVTPKLQDELIRGRIAIARLDGGYELLPAAEAMKIMERDEHSVVLLNDPVTDQVDEDDPYAQYQIPDDLMW